MLSLFLIATKSGPHRDSVRARPQSAKKVRKAAEFAGRTRTAGQTPRIAIVTNAVAYPFGEKTTDVWSMFKEYFANKDCYARTHGYDLIVDSR